MTITISSTREGFIRCGIKHTIAPKEYPNDFFKPMELERLMQDKTLRVWVTQNSGETQIFNPAEVGDPFKMSLAELKKLAKKMGLEYPKNVTQAKLAEMVNADLAEGHKAEMEELDKLAKAAGGLQPDPLWVKREAELNGLEIDALKALAANLRLTINVKASKDEIANAVLAAEMDAAKPADDTKTE